MREQDSIAIFYDAERNRFIDDNGFWIVNIYEMVRPGDVLLFKLRKEYILVDHRSMPGVTVALYYPREDEYYFDRPPWEEAYGYTY